MSSEAVPQSPPVEQKLEKREGEEPKVVLSESEENGRMGSQSGTLPEIIKSTDEIETKNSDAVLEVEQDAVKEATEPGEGNIREAEVGLPKKKSVRVVQTSTRHPPDYQKAQQKVIKREKEDNKIRVNVEGSESVQEKKALHGRARRLPLPSHLVKNKKNVKHHQHGAVGGATVKTVGSHHSHTRDLRKQETAVKSDIAQNVQVEGSSQPAAQEKKEPQQKTERKRVVLKCTCGRNIEPKAGQVWQPERRHTSATKERSGAPGNEQRCRVVKTGQTVVMWPKSKHTHRHTSRVMICVGQPWTVLRCTGCGRYLREKIYRVLEFDENSSRRSYHSHDSHRPAGGYRH